MAYLDDNLPDGWTQKRIDKHYGYDQEFEYESELESVNRDKKTGIIEVEISYFFSDWKVREWHDQAFLSPDDIYDLKTYFELDFNEFKDKTDSEIFDYINDNLIDW